MKKCFALSVTLVLAAVFITLYFTGNLSGTAAIFWFFVVKGTISTILMILVALWAWKLAKGGKRNRAWSNSGPYNTTRVSRAPAFVLIFVLLGSFTITFVLTSIYGRNEEVVASLVEEKSEEPSTGIILLPLTLTLFPRLEPVEQK